MLNGMGAQEEAVSFLKRLEKAEVDVFIWKGTVRVDPSINLGKTTEAEFTRLKPQIYSELVRRADQARSQHVAHKWLLKRGRKAHGKTVPGYLACGTEAWAVHCIRAATLFSVDVIERALWIIVEPEWVGPIVHRESDGAMTASYVKLPDGFGQAAPEGVDIEIASACTPCVERTEPPEDTEKVTKNNDE
jgi:hypothetical protein